jgi:hypothetical protein
MNRLNQAPLQALIRLRSRRGFELALGRSHLERQAAAALPAARHPIAAAYLAPYAPRSGTAASAGHGLRRGDYRRTASNRHAGLGKALGLVEAVRRLYRRAAMAADRADKERSVPS